MIYQVPPRETRINFHSQAFTLIELLIVISIITILAALLLSAIRMVREAAYGVSCISNQRQIVMAVITYAQERDGMLPYALAHDNPPPDIGAYGQSYFFHTNLLGQYLGIEFQPGEGFSTFMGPAKILRCAMDRQSPAIMNSPVLRHQVSYGLNDKFCPSIPVSTNTVEYANAWAMSTRLFRVNNFTRVGLLTDTAGDPRFDPGWNNPTNCFSYADINKTSDWAIEELWPYWWVPRHRKGANVGFLDGHVRFSPSLIAESMAKTILFAPWVAPYE